MIRMPADSFKLITPDGKELKVVTAAPTVAGYIRIIPTELSYLIAAPEKPSDGSWWIKTDEVQALVRQRDELLEAAKGLVTAINSYDYNSAWKRLRSAVEEAEGLG